jgi:phosphatidylglycerophosphate synthase
MISQPLRAERAAVSVGNPLPSIVSIALLTATIGALLVQYAHWTGWHVVAGLGGYVVISLIVAHIAGVRRQSASFGIANQVTLLRAGLVCMIGAALLAGGSAVVSGWSVAALVAVALSLDGVDGWLARRLHRSSRFGARFDLEIDALLLLILALLVWHADRVGPWILTIGMLRYAFVAAGWLWPWLREPLPPSRLRQAVCVQQGVTLLVCLLPPIDTILAGALAATALLSLLASFGADIIYLKRLDRTAMAGELDRRPC